METLTIKNPTEVIGLLFQTNSADLTSWERCKEEAADKLVFPYIIKMPCGAVQRIKEGWQVVRLPIEDIPCPCGDKTHWFVRFEVEGDR